jgi:hypothetical protein
MEDPEGRRSETAGRWPKEGDNLQPRPHHRVHVNINIPSPESDSESTPMILRGRGAAQPDFERDRLMREETPQRRVFTELRRSGHVLLVAMMAYVELSGAAVHVPALIMLDVRTSLNVSISTFTMARGVGDLLKGIFVVLCLGPAIERFGAVTCALVSMAFTALLSIMLALTQSGPTFCVTLVILTVSTALCEQPVRRLKADTPQAHPDSPSPLPPGMQRSCLHVLPLDAPLLASLSHFAAVADARLPHRHTL